MTAHPYTELDYKKYAFAKAAWRMWRVANIAGDELDDAHAHVLENALTWMWRAAFADPSSVPDPDADDAWHHDNDKARRWGELTYDDGRTVATYFCYGDEDRYEYVFHVWHPDPLHPDNRPGAEVDVCDDRYGLSVVVAAPGIIDSIDERADTIDDPAGLLPQEPHAGNAGPTP